MVAGAAVVLVGGVTTGGFSLGAAGSSVSGAVSGVSTLTLCSSACCSSVTTFAKSSGGWPSRAVFMNSSQIGSAAFAPVSFFPKGDLFVIEAHPHATSQLRRKTHEPGIGVVLRRTRFPGGRAA